MHTRVLAIFTGFILIAGCGREASHPSGATTTAPAAADATATAADLAPRYELVSVGGAPLPATIDQRPGCELKIAEASITIEGERFEFVDTFREVCDDGTKEEQQRAVGTVAVTGGQVRLQAEEGRAFNEAIGRLTGGGLVIEQFRIPGQSAPVRWEFRPAG